MTNTAITTSEYKELLLATKAPDGLFSEKLVNCLDRMNFFKTPASTRFHGAYPGGLFVHSYEVMKRLVWLTESENLEWQNSRSPWIVGLLHDLCKYDAYLVNPDTGKISFNKNQKLTGHGDKSVILINKMFEYLGIEKLTEEEELCIRWHMGAFDEKENWNKYTDAIHRYPNVLWTHTADMIASHIIGV